MLNSSFNIYDTTWKAWHAMYQAMEQSEKSIYWEVYILIDDEAGATFFDLLKNKARQGIDVKLVVDYWGSFWLSKRAIEDLRSSGVDVRLFQDKRYPIRGIKDWLMRRTHRKILVIDEHIGFIGGVNVKKGMEDWNDIHVMLKGKVVRSLLRSFAKTYIMSGGDKKNVRHLLKYSYRVKHAMFDFIFDDSSQIKTSNTRKKYVEAIIKARERIILFSPYYFPDKKLLHALWNARKRGVRIDLLIPLRTDLHFVTFAAYSWFAIMEKLGVRVHLLNRMMHGKGLVVDDDEAIIGSSNIDYASFYRTNEANVQLKDKKGVRKLKRIIQRWIEDAEKYDSKKWQKNGVIWRSKEKIARWLYKFWFGIK